MKVLQISPHFYPNIGGVETHLLDLIKGLENRGIKNFVLSYQPLSYQVKWKFYENLNGTSILRIPWLAGQFYRLISKPALEFLYLLPGVFFAAPFIILIFNPDVINAHGLVGGFTAAVWGRIFNKRVIVSVHNIYHFPSQGLYREFVKWIFNNVTMVLTLSNQSADEIKALGISSKKVDVFTYWIDLDKFKRIDKAKEKLGWIGKFIVFFIGRLIPEKGIVELVESSRKWNKKIFLVIAGTGPLSSYIEKQVKYMDNLIFVGALNNNNSPLYYSASDLLIVPSVHEEGFGRVILESLASGTPVVASNRGAIPEAMDNTVGRLITISPENIKKEVEGLYDNRKILDDLRAKTRKLAERKYSDKNVETIIKAYKRKD